MVSKLLYNLKILMNSEKYYTLQQSKKVVHLLIIIQKLHRLRAGCDQRTLGELGGKKSHLYPSL